MEKSQNNLIVYHSASIRRKIFTIRDVQVMFDKDLAIFYGVETKALNQIVKRNIERFPQEFMFQLDEKEWESLRFQIGSSNNNSLRSQIVTSKKSRRGGRRYLPFVFTEQGVAMLAGVLRSETAVKMSIQIISAFVTMRRFLATNAGIFQRLDN